MASNTELSINLVALLPKEGGSYRNDYFGVYRFPNSDLVSFVGVSEHPVEKVSEVALPLILNAILNFDVLDLGGCVSSNVINAIVVAVQNSTTIRKLGIFRTTFSTSDCEKFAKIFKKNTSLEELCFHHCVRIVELEEQSDQLVEKKQKLLEVFAKAIEHRPFYTTCKIGACDIFEKSSDPFCFPAKGFIIPGEVYSESDVSLKSMTSSK